MNLPPVLRQRFFDSNGDPLAGGKLYTYAATTATLQATYTDQSGGTPNANPVVLDTNGEAAVWLDPSLSYKFVLKDSGDVTQWTVDNVVGILTPNAVNTDSIQNGAVTLAKLSDTLGANEILGANSAGTALEGKTLIAGSNINITHTVGSIEIESPGVDSITQHLEDYDPGIKAGEAISALNAVCLDINNSTYRYFKTDSDLANRKDNFAGFATADATVTAHIQTYTINAAFVASNSISLSIKGRIYPNIVYATSSDATLQAIATLMATDPEIVSATVTAVPGTTGSSNRVITVTGRGGLTISIISSVTAGVSQPTVTLATTQAPAGDAVNCHFFGPLSGFVGLTPFAYYYLGSAAGGITSSPADTNPILVGQALSATVLFVNISNLGIRLPTPGLFIRAYGTSTLLAAGVTQDVEHFNFSSWSVGTSNTAGARYIGVIEGSATYNGTLHVVDGNDSAGTLAAYHQVYNKNSWSSESGRSVPLQDSAALEVFGYLQLCKGYAGGAGNQHDKWNGSSWSSATAFTNANYGSGVFTQNNLLRVVGGHADNVHDTMNASDVAATSTVIPATGEASGSGNNQSNGIAVVYGGTASYKWSGSWSSSIACTYDPQQTQGLPAASGYSSSTIQTYINGGTSGAASLTTSASFNGSTWSAQTSSSNARSGAAGGVL